MEKNVNNFFWAKLVTVLTVSLVLITSSAGYTALGSGVCSCGDGTATDGGSSTDACDDCEAALSDNTNCGSQVNYVGTVAVSDYVGSCIDNPEGFNNKVFDCQGNTLNGDGSGSDFGIILDDKTGNTIQNCVVTGFGEGLDLRGGSTGNNLVDNTASGNTVHGIYVGHSSGNTLTGNTASNNQRLGLYVVGFDYANTIYDNIFCNNDQMGGGFEDIRDLSTVLSGINNRCDSTDGYDDTGAVGCTYSCCQQEAPEFTGVIAALLALILTPAFAYLLVKGRN